MLMVNVLASEAPTKVVLEADHTVRIRDHVQLVQTGGTNDDPVSNAYKYDEVVFRLPYDREAETAETIEAAFADWWTYGASAEEATETTLEQRVNDLETMIAALFEMEV
jgi:hypothetical protein